MSVLPGDAANSYLIQKLQGAAGITGARMPFGGPYLDQATIGQITSWIASGAPNNWGGLQARAGSDRGVVARAAGADPPPTT
ncbi:MAG: hypothetical protein U1F11_10595 [Steroidobacteraceae bacterium]